MSATAKAKKFVATCEDCGNTVETNRKNLKYCHGCRLYRNILWLQKRQKPKECPACKRDFLPIERNAMVCGGCDIVEHYHGDTVCIVCDETGPAVRSGLPVCWGCATDPEARKDLFSALSRGRASRVAANGWTPGTTIPLEEVAT